MIFPPGVNRAEALNLIRSALYYASEWERTLADSWKGVEGPEYQTSINKAKKYLELRGKMFGNKDIGARL